MEFDLKKWYDSKLDSDVLYDYIGEFDKSSISRILNQVEINLRQHKEDGKRIKKIYKVLVECLQNLYHHGQIPPQYDLYDNNLGVFILRREGDGYRISTGNFIRLNDIKLIKDRIDQINFLSPSEKRDLYRLILTNDHYSEKGGGGLGIIDIARKTGNNMEYHFFEYNKEFLFLELNVLIS